MNAPTQQQQPVMPQPTATATSAPAVPPSPTSGGALTGGVTIGQGNAPSGTNPFGYSSQDMARMPWINALNGGTNLPSFQEFGGPLSLGQIKAPQGMTNPFDPNFPAVPAPHQLPLQQWLKMTPQEQQMALGTYRALGFMPEDVSQLMTRQAPGTVSGAPTAWRV
jgi:hypothetical protein